MQGMDGKRFQPIVPIYVTNNCKTYGAILLKSSHHDGCYYPTTVYAGTPFPPNDYTPHGLSVGRPFRVITQKGMFVLIMKNMETNPVLSIFLEGHTEPAEMVGQESLQTVSLFKIELTVDETGSLSYVKKDCAQDEVSNSEYYGKKMPVKTFMF